MQQRFEGDTGKRLLADALLVQRLVGGSPEIASYIAGAGQVRQVPAGDCLTAEGNSDNSVYFIISGSFRIVVRGREVATRGPGETVGEIAAIDPSQPRSGDVIAVNEAIVIEITEPQLSELASDHPIIWKRLAIDMARRVVQRNSLVSATNERIQVFIMSSVEGLPIAQEIQSGLSHEDFQVTIWTNGVFLASDYPLESLENAVEASDFAIAIVRPDDTVESREQKHKAPRDNVVFELGMFAGKLGRKRTILVEPREDKAQLPTDLRGVNTIGYRSKPEESISANLGPVCTAIAKLIRAAGPK